MLCLRTYDSQGKRKYSEASLAGKLHSHLLKSDALHHEDADSAEKADHVPCMLCPVGRIRTRLAAAPW